MAAHPDDHEGDDRDRAEADDRLQHLLLALGQLLVEDLQGDADAGAEQDRDDHAGPHVAQRAGLALLAQERRDDADDQRGLEALAQADHVRGDHGAAPYQKLGLPN